MGLRFVRVYGMNLSTQNPGPKNTRNFKKKLSSRGLHSVCRFTGWHWACRGSESGGYGDTSPKVRSGGTEKGSSPPIFGHEYCRGLT